MAWYHINLRNQWTRANPGYEDADLGAWQVGLAACGQFTMVGVFDHVIESSSRIRNFSQGMDLVWADVVLALGNGFGFLHNGQGTTVELSAGSVLDHFGRWGRNPDDVADWMIFSRQTPVAQDWWNPLSNHASKFGPKGEAAAGIADRYSGVVVWALDGHLYGVLPISESDILRRLMPAAAVLKLRVAEHHELIE